MQVRDDARYIVNPYLAIVRCTGDELLVRHGSRSTYSRVLLDEGRRNLLGRVLAAFETPTAPDTAAAKFDGDDGVLEIIDRLVHERVIIDEREHLPSVYLSLGSGGEATPLHAVSVGLYGLGPLGAVIGRQLAAMGVGHVTGVDDRIVSERDALFLAATVGRASPGASLAENFTASMTAAGLPGAVGRAGLLDDEDDLVELVEANDVTVAAFEAFRPTLLHAVNHAAIAAGKPWLPVHADGSEAIIGPLVVPGRSPCFNEFEVQHEASRTLRSEYLLYKEQLEHQPLVGSYQLVPPLASLVASWAVVGLLPFLLTGSSHLVGKALRVDFERAEITQERILRLPRCPACSSLRPDYRHPFL